ncbi:sarcosine oxidase subunit gamma family protein [Chelativorans sp. ZYF759]|uniref:sarcosine oxidase subunit gamma family protein n=1 Tax=Chelativorans sp. ZYF759 TaxID=2692213 RepID=UPI00145F105A|nr:sarcosine oxidase subunit gamma family protein [Chelativorans sp. ZYF759]NMG41308.1 sarcosine oxidase subunit gamma family protein [Chelativorans sp. ZYF759]
MVEQVSPLGAAYRLGRHGRAEGTPGITLTETRPGSIVQIGAWPGREGSVVAAASAVLGVPLANLPRAGAVSGHRAIFGIGPGLWLASDQVEDLASRLLEAIGAEDGTVTDLSHGRIALRIAGPSAEWVLSKFFAIDFSLSAFPVEAGRATAHHDIFVHIQRTGEDAFDLYVFRSFARSFWIALCHASEETGYEVR